MNRSRAPVALMVVATILSAATWCRLDEATSALDALSEPLAAGRATPLIAHRPVEHA